MRGRERIDLNDVYNCWLLLCHCWRCLGVPFIASKGLGAVGIPFGKLSSGKADRCAFGPLGAPDTVWCTLDSLVRQLTIGLGHVSPADFAVDRWLGRLRLIGQSGEF
jgi:hypothetical protein